MKIDPQTKSRRSPYSGSNKDRRAGSDELLRKEKGLNYLRWQKQFREVR